MTSVIIHYHIPCYIRSATFAFSCSVKSPTLIPHLSVGYITPAEYSVGIKISFPRTISLVLELSFLVKATDPRPRSDLGGYIIRNV